MSSSNNISLFSSSTPEPWFSFELQMVSGSILQLIGMGFYSFILRIMRRMMLGERGISPFYSVFFYFGVIDNSHGCVLFYMNVMNWCAHGPVFPVLHLITSDLTSVFYLTNIIGNGVLAVNRYSATYTTHRKYFSDRVIKCLPFVVLGISTLLSIPCFFTRRQHFFNETTLEWKSAVIPVELMQIQRSIIIAAILLCVSVVFVFYALARRRVTVFIYSSKYHKSEKTLLYLVVIHSAFHLWMGVYEGIELFEVHSKFAQLVRETGFFMFNFCIFMNGFIVAFTSARIRSELIRMVFESSLLFNNKVSTSQNNPNQTQTTRF